MVAKGYDQIYGIDYYETFASVVKIQTLRTILAIAADCDLKFHQIKYRHSILNGELNEEIFIEPPPGCNDLKKIKYVSLRNLFRFKASSKSMELNIS